MSVLNNPVLILNKTWTPIRARTVKDAVRLLTSEKAVVINHNCESFAQYDWDSWICLDVPDGDEYIPTSSTNIVVPKVIVLSHYNKFPDYSVRLSKKNIAKRDKMRDQYTGELLTDSNSDIDHVLPRSRGGKNTWENLVLVKKETNRQKADRTPEEAGLKLIKKPQKPNSRDFVFDCRKEVPEFWANFMDISRFQNND